MQTNLIKGVLGYAGIRRLAIYESAMPTDHRMFDIEVDASLLGIDTDLDSKVDRPAMTVQVKCPNDSSDTHRLTGTRMLSKRAEDGFILGSQGVLPNVGLDSLRLLN